MYAHSMCCKLCVAVGIFLLLVLLNLQAGFMIKWFKTILVEGKALLSTGKVWQPY